MSVKADGSYREIKVDDKFGQHMRSPTRLSRGAAIKRAEAELRSIQPRIEGYVKLESKNLEAALMAARQKDESYATNVRNAYAASQNIRDVANSIGYSLIGFIATNLCTIIEVTDAVSIECPAAIFDCYYQALRLALGRNYVKKSLKELPELSAGLLQTVHMVKGLAVRAAGAKTSVAKQS